jgi:hypothetical protein
VTTPQDRLKEKAVRLRYLGSYPPNNRTRAEVAAALNSKWEGLVATAVRCLCGWGDARSLEELRRWLFSSRAKKDGGSLMSVICESLAKSYRPEDVDWILDYYFGHVEGRSEHTFRRDLARVLPATQVEQRIMKETRNPDTNVRRKALDLAVHLRSRLNSTKLITEFTYDSDQEIKARANQLLDTMDT